VHNGFVYAIGGADQDFNLLSDVSVASISANGSVGAWAATTALPAGRRLQSSVAYNGFVYVIGGYDANFTLLTDVLVASLNEDGSVGPWAATTALPSGRYNHSSVAYNGFIYAIGGLGGSYISDVLVAPFNADGSVGAWTTTTALPSGRNAHSSVVHNGFVYALGGEDANYDILSDVSVAPINADGSVGAWLSTTAFPSGRILHSSVAYNGFVYAIGGFEEQNYGPVSAVLVAPLNADGSVGDWSSTAALPSERWFHSSVAYNGFIYTMGGNDYDFVFLSDSLGAPINLDVGNANQTPDRLRGVYSHLVDLESDAATRYVTLNGFISPGGAVRLQARVAPDATGVFGAETVVDPAPLGSAIQVSGTGRYVWIRLTLDDTGASDVDDPTYISDITVSETAPPEPGVVFDGSGTDIDTQSSTSTIEANWSGFTPAVGDSIVSYEWAIGTAPGMINVQGWMNVGLATSASNASLSLTSGMKFVSVRATSAAGLTSPVATSNGVRVLPAESAPAGDDGHKGRCGQSASTAPGSGWALLGGLTLLASRIRRRNRRR
jgi:hypothetical protein